MTSSSPGTNDESSVVPSEALTFPSKPPDGVDDAAYQKALFETRVELLKKQIEADQKRNEAEVEDELSLNAEYHKAQLEVAKGSIERSQGGADTVQKAASAIATVYTAALALAFSVTERPLPSRGAIPVIFFGLAVVLSTVYLAYITHASDTAEPGGAVSLREAIQNRTNTFIYWVRNIVRNRAYWLRASVIALGMGVILLPAPFISWTNSPSASASSKPTWPQTPTEVTNIELQKILYKAQVDEVTEARKAGVPGSEDDGNDSLWWIGGLIGLIIVFVGPNILTDAEHG